MTHPRALVVSCVLQISLLSTATAADHFVRSGATGTADGTSWTNAWPSLPATLVRGHTYYVAAGDYPAYKFDDPAVGTTVITIRRATAADHGSAPDWNASYGSGPATFGNLTIATSYWVIDGGTGSGPDPASYGFSVRTVTTGTADQSYVMISAGDVASFAGITLRHLAITCPGPSLNVGQGAVVTGSQSTVDDTVIQNIYVDNCQNAIVLHGSKWLIEKNYFGKAWSSSTHHGEQIDSHVAKIVTFRYNVIAQCTGTTCIGNFSIDNWSIYGNVFANIVTGNGVIGVGGSESITNTVIYNNTIVNNQSSSFLYQNNPGAGAGSGNVVKNNLFFKSNGNLAQNGGGTIESAYNAFYQCAQFTSGTADQVSSLDPFVNSAATDYHLAAATQAGTSLPAPFTTDMDGKIRGQDSTWDRGAYEYLAGWVPLEGGIPAGDRARGDGPPRSDASPDRPAPVNDALRDGAPTADRFGEGKSGLSDGGCGCEVRSAEQRRPRMGPLAALGLLIMLAGLRSRRSSR